MVDVNTSHSHDPIDPALLDHYFAGDCTPEQLAEVKRWLAARPANADLVAVLRREFGIRDDDHELPDASTVWARIAERLAMAAGAERPSVSLHMVRGDDDLPTSDPSPTAPRIGLQRGAPRMAVSPGGISGITWRLVAAALAIVALGASVHLFGRGTSGTARLSRTDAPTREYATTRGQRAEVRLVDGTRVVLAPASRIVLPASYDSRARELTLEGEAYFDVVHDERRPFTVRTASALIHDLGTRFGVRAYAEERAVSVIVTHGLVRVGRDGEGAGSEPLLRAGDLARLRPGGMTTISHGVDTTRFTSWVRGTLVFDRTPVPDALAEIARWYDVEMLIADSTLARGTLTATLNDGSLSEAIDLVALSLDARAEERGRTITLHAGRVARPRR